MDPLRLKKSSAKAARVRHGAAVDSSYDDGYADGYKAAMDLIYGPSAPVIQQPPKRYDLAKPQNRVLMDQREAIRQAALRRDKLPLYPQAK